MKVILNKREAKILHILLIHELRTAPWGMKEYRDFIDKLDNKIIKQWWKKPLK